MIPAASTTITIKRNETDDPDEDAVWEPVASGIRAHIDTAAVPSTIGGQLVTGDLWADECDLRLADRVEDDRTGETWQAALTVRKVRAVQGLEHVRAGLARVEC